MMFRWIGVALAVLALQQPAAPALSVSGRVVDDVTGKPIRGATVSLEPHRPKLVLTDEDGSFTFRNLSAGSYELSARHDGYLYAEGATVVPHAGPPLREISVSLVPAAWIEGRVFDERGEPAAHVPVSLMQRAVIGGVAYVGARSSSDTVATDTDGSYRFGPLKRGNYLVGTSFTYKTYPVRRQRDGTVLFPRSKLPIDPRATFALDAPPQNFGVPVSDPTRAYTPAFYPHATDTDRAETIDLFAGEVRANIDLHLVAVPTHRLSGKVVGPHGPLADATLSLSHRATTSVPTHDDMSTVATAQAAADGSFTFLNVAAGSYTLHAGWIDPRLVYHGMAWTSEQPLIPPAPLPPPDPNGFWNEMPIVIGGADVARLTVTLRPRVEVRGRVVVGDQSGPQPSAIEGYGLSLDPLNRAPTGPPIELKCDVSGTCSAFGLTPGRYLLRAGASSGWIATSATAGGVDLLTSPLEIGERSVSDLVVTFTRQPSTRPSALYGSVRDDPGSPAADPIVVVYTTRSGVWNVGAASGVVRARAAGGRFVINGLGPGDYFVSAIDGAMFREGANARLFPVLAETEHIDAVDRDLRIVRMEESTPDARLLAAWSRTAVRVTVEAGARVGVTVPLTRVAATPRLSTAVPALARELPRPRIRPSGASIEGTVLDTFGDPAGDVEVSALQPGGHEHGGLAVIGSARTDRLGRYAIDGLPPGEYRVALPLHMPDAAFDMIDATGQHRTVARSDVYYPGVTEFAKAEAITLARDALRDRVDLRMAFVPAVELTGTVTAPTPPTMTQTQVRLIGPDGHFAERWNEIQYSRDGRVAFTGIVAGTYTVVAYAHLSAPTEQYERSLRYWGRAVVTSDGQRGSDLTIATQPGAVVNARFRFEGVRPQDDDPQFSLTPIDPASPFAYMLDTWVQPFSSETDTITWNGLPPGAYAFTTSLNGWRIASITRGGHDITTTPLQLTYGDHVGDVVITLARR